MKINLAKITKLQVLEAASKYQTVEEWATRSPHTFRRAMGSRWVTEALPFLGTRAFVSRAVIERLERREKRALMNALRSYPNTILASQSLGLSYSTFGLKLKKYGLIVNNRIVAL